jgi:hypothetical protein
MDVRFESASDSGSDEESQRESRSSKRRKEDADTFVASVCGRLPCAQLLTSVAAAAAKTERFAERLTVLPEAEREQLSRSPQGQDLVDVALAFEDLRLGLQRLREVLLRQPVVMVHVPGTAKLQPVGLDLTHFRKYKVLVSLGTADAAFVLIASTHAVVRDKEATFLEVAGRVGEPGSTRYQERARKPRGVKLDCESELALALRAVLVEQLGVLKPRARSN